MEVLTGIYNGAYIPWIDRFIKRTGKAMDSFAMDESGDHILAGISGGKDSFALVFALRMLQKWHSRQFRLSAVFLDWEEFPATEHNIGSLRQFCGMLDVPFLHRRQSAFRLCGRENFSCYFCAREKKLQMFRIAEQLQARKVAFGHHLDDHVETAMMNLFFRGKLDPMQPKGSFFQDRYFVIRPLCLISEPVIENLADTLSFPVFPISCPHKETNIRAHIKPLLSELHKMDRHVKMHVFDAYAGYYSREGPVDRISDEQDLK
ncbi:MAG: adenine nucleotide alpha hydrolase [Spirochaetales bacterium]|nr:adenine nucleotide alpha hydrolase [Spirochaetales bacterium]